MHHQCTGAHQIGGINGDQPCWPLVGCQLSNHCINLCRHHLPQIFARQVWKGFTGKIMEQMRPGGRAVIDDQGGQASPCRYVLWWLQLGPWRGGPAALSWGDPEGGCPTLGQGARIGERLGAQRTRPLGRRGSPPRV